MFLRKVAIVNSLRQARMAAFLLVTLILAMVAVFGRQPERPSDELANTDDGYLQLRKAVTLSIQTDDGDRNHHAPIPDDRVPIDWQDQDLDVPARLSEPKPLLPQKRAAPAPRFEPAADDGQLPAAPSQHGSSTHRTNDAPRPQRAFRESPPVTPTHIEIRPQRTGPPPSEPRPPKPPNIRYHRIVDGETLRDISNQYLGSPDHYLEIFEANRSVLPHPDVLPLHSRIVIPQLREQPLPWPPASRLPHGILLPRPEWPSPQDTRSDRTPAWQPDQR